MSSFGYAGEKLTLKIRKRTFEAMLNQEMGWYDRKENAVGSLCAKLSGDSASVQGVIFLLNIFLIILNIIFFRLQVFRLELF